MSIAARVRCVPWRPRLLTYAPASHCTFRTLARAEIKPRVWAAGTSQNSLQSSHLTCAIHPTAALSWYARTHSTQPTVEAADGKFELVYRAPLKAAVRAIKVFSLCTATAAVLGGPVLVMLGNPSVPLVGRVALSTLVMLVGVSTTAILHWLLKGYIIKMEYNKKTEKVIAHVMSVTARIRKHEFSFKDMQAPPQSSAFSTFQVKGKQYFVHTEVVQDMRLLSKLLGPSSSSS